MKPFDLEKAKAGAPVQTRDGRPVRILCFDRQSEMYPIVALISHGSCDEAIENYTVKGQHSVCQPPPMPSLDLFMSPVKREGWVNVYSMEDGNFFTGKFLYETEERGRKGASDNGGYVTTAKITWEE